MSPRRARRAGPYDRVDRRRGVVSGRGPVPGSVPGVDRVEDWPDGEWVVRQVSGAGGRAYRCPGCDQEIRPGLPHLVSWPNWDGGEEERRHWHTVCWRKRRDRGPGRTRY
ncbi:ATP/GTP-binding protein [Thermopolyspora sp. NPDC052614]|uniref:ATP/GTP-binding protein n=1 Tax=Thermopolyspora sp. NPDC052614 TaxID=3155682 RepID=UPI0034135529